MNKVHGDRETYVSVQRASSALEFHRSLPPAHCTYGANGDLMNPPSPFHRAERRLLYWQMSSCLKVFLKVVLHRA